MMRLRYLTSAHHDLHLIYEYIARDNPTAARRVITAIRIGTVCSCYLVTLAQLSTPPVAVCRLG